MVEVELGALVSRVCSTIQSPLRACNALLSRWYRMASFKRKHQHNISNSVDSSSFGGLEHRVFSTPTSAETTETQQTPSFQHTTPGTSRLIESERHVGDGLPDKEAQQFVLSIAWRAGRLGAAYFETRSRELHVVTDIAENPDDFSVLRSLFFQVQPHSMLAKFKQDEGRMAALNDLVGFRSASPGSRIDRDTESLEDDVSDDEGNRRSREMVGTSCKLHLLASNYFNLEAGKRKLFSLRLQNQPSNMTEMEKMIYFKSIFPMDYPACMQATGALLKVLEQWKIGQDVEQLTALDDRCSLVVSSIHVDRLEDFVWMDQTTFLSLQIFSQQAHPASFKKGQSSSSKEGLSLFGITAKCYSAPGYVHLRNMFLRPTRNVTTLKQRYRVIRFCIQSSNIEVVNNLISSLRHISNIKVVLADISIMQGSVNEWKKLQTTLQHLLALCDICSSLPQDIELFRQLSTCRDSGQLYRLTKVIHRLIDFEESKRVGRCIIHYGNDSDLDTLKRTYNNLPRIYSQVAVQELEDLPHNIEKGCIEFFPDHGHCLCLESWFPEGHEISATDMILPDLDFVFSASNNIYYKSRRCQELDEQYGDMAAEITKHEMRLLVSASQNILENSEPLRTGIELAGQLDALLSMAFLSSEFGLVEPELVYTDQSAEIHIDNGRHILQEMCIDNFVPNSTALGGDNRERIHILTGPNSSGKSIYLKQVALIVYMAQIGCFVPAKHMRLGPVTHIFTLSHAPETAAVSLSQFGIQLTMMSAIQKKATSSSLLIMDEFGQGTSHVDGTALFISCISHWIEQGHGSPLILTATHLHCAANYLSKNASQSNVRFMSMGYTCDKGELIFLYQPVSNLCGNSFPFTVAQGVGVPRFVISRGKEVLEAIQSCGELLPLASVWSESTARRLRQNIEDILSIDAEDVTALKQCIRRNITEESSETVGENLN